jgi:hypothetical protein
MVGAMNAMIGLAFGIAAGVGVLLVVLGAQPHRLGPARQKRRPIDTDGLLLRAASAIGVAVAVFAITRWPVGSIMGGGLAALGPSLAGAKARRREGIARTEAIAAWAEMLRDTMASSAGLGEAITVSARVAPPAIKPAVKRLASEIERGPLVPALRRFAEVIDDPAADIVVAALIVAAERQARNLGEVLGTAATSARATATMRLRLEASRARTYTASRLIVGITLAMTAALIVLDRGYLYPFNTAAGQLMLLVIGVVFAAGLWSLSRLSASDGPGRVLTNVGDR